MSFVTERKTPEHFQGGMVSESGNEATEFEKDNDEHKNSNRKTLVFAVHFCNVLYAACFWIQIGVYPVREILLLLLSIIN